MKQRVRYSKSLTFVIVMFSLLMLGAGIAFGQAISGNLVGTVSDPSGAVVSNAEVTATNVGTNASAVTHTNGTGEYRFDNLPVGNYK
ncbi:MAG TPA: carboxypeptidase-like regulatory domain-containing protein, partial [Candidatus Sulfotelmatobacter sp.]